MNDLKTHHDLKLLLFITTTEA